MTDNLRHFPASKVPAHIQAVAAKDFAADTADVDPAQAAKALGEIARRHCNPRHSPSELIDLLVSRYGMDDVADLLRYVLSDPRSDLNQD